MSLQLLLFLLVLPGPLAAAEVEHVVVVSLGYSPDRADQRAAFVVAGAGANHGRLAEASILAVAPTVAWLLSLELPEAEGGALQELFHSLEERAIPTPH